MLRSTRDIRVVVLSEKWSKGWKNSEGKEFPEGWSKPKGWPARGSQRPDGDLNNFSKYAFQAYHNVSLWRALTIRSESPAFFVGYQPNSIHLRLRKDALHPLFSGFTEDGGGVKMHLALFDVDNHDELADVEQWFDSELPKIEALQEVHPGTIVYRSRRGYRIISTLAEPMHLKDTSDSLVWDRTYTAWCNYLKRKFQINADVLLDWTRFQGIPHTKKDKDLPALELEVIGDVEWIGTWEPLLENSDFPPERKVGVYDGANFEGTCQLLALVQRAGLRCDATEYDNVYDICCPNWTAHSPDSRGLQDYPSKTVLYTNGPIGKIECKSSNCQASHPDRNKSYFQHFAPIDVEQTRPLPPVDVWDPMVRYWSDLRNAECDKASLDIYLSDNLPEDTTYSAYKLALSLQARLTRK